MRGCTAVVLASIAITSMLAGQSPAFEVASIRKNTSANSRVFMDGSGGRYTVTNATVRMLIVNGAVVLSNRSLDSSAESFGRAPRGTPVMRSRNEDGIRVPNRITG